MAENQRASKVEPIPLQDHKLRQRYDSSVPVDWMPDGTPGCRARTDGEENERPLCVQQEPMAQPYR